VAAHSILRYRVRAKCLHDIVVYCPVGWATSDITKLTFKVGENYGLSLVVSRRPFLTTEDQVRSQASLHGKMELCRDKIFSLSTSVVPFWYHHADSNGLIIHPSPLRYNLRNLQLRLMTHTHTHIN